MHFSWLQHLELARCIEAAGDQEYWVFPAFMGVGIAVLMRDLEQDLLNTSSAAAGPRLSALSVVEC